MPAIAPANRIHPLCYEHHSEMSIRKSSSNEDGMSYACSELGCVVSYSRADGYFLNTQNQFLIKQCPIPPHQYCSNDRYVGSGKSEPPIPEILSRFAFSGKFSSKLR
jgi:hypothetical protein